LIDVVVINLKNYVREEELVYGSLYFKLAKKLPEQLITSYQRWIQENKKTENVGTLKDWITMESEFQMIASETVRGLSSEKCGRFDRSKKHKNAQSFFAKKEKFKENNCAYRQERHGIWKCQDFKQLTVAARWQIAKEKRLCFRCLENDHMGQSCHRGYSCEKMVAFRHTIGYCIDKLRQDQVLYR
jgi:hypothetical protein